MSSNRSVPPSVPRRLLAILLNHPGQLAAYRAQLDQIRFADAHDQATYRALRATIDEAADAESVDVADVLHHLEAHDQLKQVGGRERILGLLDEPGTLQTKPLPTLVEAVTADYTRRAAAESIERIAQQAKDGTDPTTLAELVNKQIAALRLLGAPKFEPLGARTDDLIAHFQDPSREPALPTGIPALDELIGGLQPTHLVTIAGSTSMGKSSLAGQIALAGAHIAKNNPGHFGGPAGKVAPVLIFSFEMPARAFHTRMVSQRSPVQHGYHSRYGWKNEDKPIAIEGAKRLRDLPIYVFDGTAPTAEAVRAEVDAFIQDKGTKPALVIVDHIGLMGAPRLTNPTEVMSHVSGAMKTMAQQLAVPVVELAQLSRDHGKRDNHRPTLFDLKQSGDVENNSDVVVFVHRESKFLPDEERKAVEEGGCPAEIIVAKSRYGEMDTVRAAWLGYRQLFVPDPNWVSRYASDHDLSGGIIEYPALDRSAFDSQDASPVSSTNGKANGSAGLPIEPQALLAFAESQPAGITNADVRGRFGVSRDIADTALNAQVNAGELEKATRLGRAVFIHPGAAARAFEKSLTNDQPF